MSFRGRVREKLDQAQRAIVHQPARRLDQRPDLAVFDIGRYSWGHLRVTNRTPGHVLTVGHFCSFAYGTEVLLGGEHRADFVTTYRFGVYSPFKEWFQPVSGDSVSRGDVTIGSDVWIGHQSVVLSGVTVGDGAIVGAGSIVRQSVPPYAIVMGNPARVAGFRFSAEQIEALLRIKWWNWSDERIVSALDLMMSTDIQHFIDAYDISS